MAANSIDKSTACKPDKPYKDFPLYAHASKRWAKKIKGKTFFFGPWDDWQAALDKFQYENDWRQKRETPPPRNPTALSVGDMVNGLLAHRDAKVKSGEMTERTFTDYKRTGTLLISSLGRQRSV